MKKNFNPKLLLIPILFMLIITGIFSVANINQQKTQEKNFKITDIKGYLYKTLSLSFDGKDYKFVGAKSNSIGDILYVFQLYKAKGTLLVYINLPSNSIGYRIINEIKVPSVFAVNNRKEILINTFAGGNKFYYISPKVNIYSFESPSYNLSEPFVSDSYFYWLGYKYGPNKKIDKKTKIFRYKYNSPIESFDISNLLQNFKKQRMEILQIKFFDKYVVFNLYNKSSKNFYIFSYDLSKNEFKQLYKGEGVFIDYSINKDLFFVDNEKDKAKVIFYKFDLEAYHLQEIFTLNSYGKLNYFKMLNPKNNSFIISFLNENDSKENTSKEEEKYTNLMVNNSKVFIEDKAPAVMDGYYENRTNKIGVFYLFKDFVAELIY